MITDQISKRAINERSYDTPAELCESILDEWSGLNDRYGIPSETRTQLMQFCEIVMTHDTSRPRADLELALSLRWWPYE